MAEPKKPVQKKPVQKKPVQKKPAQKKPVKHTEPVHTAKKKPSAKNKAKKKRSRIVLFVLEIFILLIMVVVLYSVFKIEKVGKVNLPAEEFVINPEVEEKVETTMKGYQNIALFGVDSTSGALTKNTRSDTIMIASLNQDTGECKLVSVYRDTYLNLSNDSYNKCNSAYAKGGPMQAINMLNMNLDMNIKDFITVGFAGLSNTVDALGGIMIDIDDVELKHINNYQKTMASDMGRSYTPVESTGYQLLDGLQATAYCRIRYGGGDDFKRTERQREVLLAIFDKAKSASPATLTSAVNAIFDNGEIYTSLDVSDILDILGNITKYEVVGQGGFPEESRRTTGTIGSKGSCVVPVSLADNVQWLHEFLFEDEEYSPSDAVIEYSNKVEADTSGYVK
ncbi:MAG: LCP family protein [Lachnospiraceae bacterium]|nr:LCP family protein [Lachnospiraceae bacterium]